MNSAGQAGSFVCTVLFGYLITWYGNYDVPLVVIAAMVCVSSILFFHIDPSEPLLSEAHATAIVEEPAACG